MTHAEPRMVTPGMIGDDVVVVLGVQTESPHGAYLEWDLQYLALFAQALAPFVLALENVEQLRRENEQLRAESGQSRHLVGRSPEISKVRHEIAKAAKTSLNALIMGETGTGKELAARCSSTKWGTSVWTAQSQIRDSAL